MLIVSECVAKAALEREESRGGHTREDFPTMDPGVAADQPGLLADADGSGVRPARTSRCPTDAGRTCSGCSTCPS